MLPKPGLLTPTARRRSRGQPAASAQPNAQNQAPKAKRPAPHDEFSQAMETKSSTCSEAGRSQNHISSRHGGEQPLSWPQCSNFPQTWPVPIGFCASGQQGMGPGSSRPPAFPLCRNCKVPREPGSRLKTNKGKCFSAFSHHSQIDGGTRCQKARPRYGHWKRWESRRFVPAPSWLKACASLNARGFPSPPRV